MKEAEPARVQRGSGPGQRCHESQENGAIHSGSVAEMANLTRKLSLGQAPTQPSHPLQEGGVLSLPVQMRRSWSREMQ